MIVCDLDDTLCDARWRMPLWGQWDAFYAEAHLDKPIVPMVKLIRSAIILKLEVIIVTSREERFRPLTVSWLLRHGLDVPEVRMRPDGNFMTSPELKLFLTEDIRGEIELVIDDRDDVLTAFRGVGIPTLQTFYAGGEI
jgi:hypothetical protein